MMGRMTLREVRQALAAAKAEGAKALVAARTVEELEALARLLERETETEAAAEEPAIPRQYSLVRFRFDLLPVEYHDRYPFAPGGVYVFFGDIPNMPGHCVVADHKSGRIYSGYHTDWFTELPDEG